ncbi:MAG: hypothetical protein QM762_08785 [Chryseolinea sp.]
MAVLASSIINDVAADLFDPGNVRWTRPDLLGYLNDGMRELLLYRPDANTVLQSTALAAGSLQALPAIGGQKTRLLDVKANTSGRSVKFAKAESLDDQRSNWRNDPQSTTIKAWIYDMRLPDYFEVWPPAQLGASLLLVLSVPVDDLADEGDALPLDDMYKGPLMSYMKHRACLRDSEDAAMKDLADSFYALMGRQLLGKSSSEGAEKPELAATQRKDITK